MSIKIKCDCGKKFKIPNEQAGKKAKCPNCNSILKIPEIELSQSKAAMAIRTLKEVSKNKINKVRKKKQTEKPENIENSKKTKPSTKTEKLENKKTPTKKTTTPPKKNRNKNKNKKPETQENKKTNIILLVVLFILGSTGGFFFFKNKQNTTLSNSETNQTTTEENSSSNKIKTTIINWNRAEKEFAAIKLGSIKINDKRFKKPINPSQENELTFASFNIRNLSGERRSIRELEKLSDLIQHADIIVVQEVGLGVYSGPLASPNAPKRIRAIAAVFNSNLGKNFATIIPPEPSGTGSGIETTLLFYKKECKGFQVSAEWKQYIDLGDKRDMPLFQLKLTKGSASKILDLGSVHLTPGNPERGKQMEKVASWLISRKNEAAMVMGDFNWGYQKNRKKNNYPGEEKIRKLHQEKELFQLFYHLSYLGKAKSNQLQTNLNFRKEGFFYDQILMTPTLASLLADNGKIFEDCGLLRFEGEMKEAIQKLERNRKTGLEFYLKKNKDKSEKIYQETLKKIELQSKNEATYIFSDHCLIWTQIKVW